MNKRLEFLIRKNKGLVYMEKYKSEINKLVYNDYSILNLEESDRIKEIKIYNTKKSLLNGYFWQQRSISFKNKQPLVKIVDNIKNIYNDIVYMSLDYSDICGLVKLDNINCFNAFFDFHDEHAGLISLCDKSLDNSLVIDFYDEDTLLFYDIQLYGTKWISIGHKKNDCK